MSGDDLDDGVAGTINELVQLHRERARSEARCNPARGLNDVNRSQVLDTEPGARQVVAELLHRMTPAERWSRVEAPNRDVERLAEVGIRRCPGWPNCSTPP